MATKARSKSSWCAARSALPRSTSVVVKGWACGSSTRSWSGRIRPVFRGMVKKVPHLLAVVDCPSAFKDPHLEVWRRYESQRIETSRRAEARAASASAAAWARATARRPRAAPRASAPAPASARSAASKAARCRCTAACPSAASPTSSRSSSPSSTWAGWRSWKATRSTLDRLMELGVIKKSATA